MDKNLISFIITSAVSGQETELTVICLGAFFEPCEVTVIVEMKGAPVCLLHFCGKTVIEADTANLSAETVLQIEQELLNRKLV